MNRDLKPTHNHHIEHPQPDPRIAHPAAGGLTTELTPTQRAQLQTLIAHAIATTTEHTTPTERSDAVGALTDPGVLIAVIMLALVSLVAIVAIAAVLGLAIA